MVSLKFGSLEPKGRKGEIFEISKVNISRTTRVPIKIFAVLNSPRHGECRHTKIFTIEATTAFCNLAGEETIPGRAGAGRNESTLLPSRRAPTLGLL
jgi:hypothetical protein